MALIKCPECGKSISDKSDRCIHCGYPIYLETNNLSERIICPYCGSKNFKSNSNCNNCGATLMADNKMQNPEAEKGEEIINGVVVDVISILEKHPYKSSRNIAAATEITRLTKCDYFEAMSYIKKYESKVPKCESSPDLKTTPKPSAFEGIYKITVWNEKIPVYCPRCNSSKCSYFQQEKVIPGKTKTKYSANLNPFKPFTLVNKKETVVRPDRTITESMIQCENCGFVFK